MFHLDCIKPKLTEVRKNTYTVYMYRYMLRYVKRPANTVPQYYSARTFCPFNDTRMYWLVRWQKYRSTCFWIGRVLFVEFCLGIKRLWLCQIPIHLLTDEYQYKRKRHVFCVRIRFIVSLGSSDCFISYILSLQSSSRLCLTSFQEEWRVEGCCCGVLFWKTTPPHSNRCTEARYLARREHFVSKK